MASASYDEFVHRTLMDPIIKNYSLILLGRHRHLKIQLLYNRLTGLCYSTKKNNNLQHILKKRFGEDAIGILAGGDVWYDEEELMRSGMVVDHGRYHVLYDDDTPSYSEATLDPPIHHVPTPLPTFAQLEGNTIPTTTTRLKEKRIHGFTYFEDIPDFKRSVMLRLSSGNHKLFTMTNKNVEWVDQLIHFLSLEGGDRWIGVKVADKEFLDDTFMFSSDCKEGMVVDVTYRLPPPLKLLARRMEKKREVVYATLIPEM